jgi:hypothetical protein
LDQRLALIVVSKQACATSLLGVWGLDFFAASSAVQHGT